MANTAPIPTLTTAERERFFANTHRPADSECLLWTGAILHAGYGSINIRGKNYRAARVAWTIHKGAIPDGITVDHLCNQRRCVEIEHLRLVTERANTWRRGAARRRWSEDCWDLLPAIASHPSKVVDHREAAKLINLDHKTVKECIQKGELRATEIVKGIQWEIRTIDLSEMVARRAAEDAGITVIQALIDQQREDAA